MAKTPLRREARLSRLLLALLVWSAASGCHRDDAPSAICPPCTPRVGGETTSFERPQGLLSSCYAIIQGSVIDADEAEALGFAVSVVRPRIERDFGTPLHWHAQSSDLGAPATGYEASTTAHVRTNIIGYYMQTPDASKCEPSTTSPCMFEGDTCIASLRIGVSVHIQTDDGALAATLSGSTLILLDSDSTFNRELEIDANADVTSVVGNVRLMPTVPAPFSGTLNADFSADGTQGSLWFVVAPVDRDAGFSDEPIGAGVSYQPLQGLWGRAEDLFGATPTTTAPPAP